MLFLWSVKLVVVVVAAVVVCLFVFSEKLFGHAHTQAMIGDRISSTGQLGRIVFRRIFHPRTVPRVFFPLEQLAQ